MLRVVSLITAGALTLTPVVWGQPATEQHANRKAAHNGQNEAGVQQAIAFERLKAREDAAQARRERLHPTQYNYQADRQAENDSTVPDTGSKQNQKNQKIH
jgi:hypothetical protein